MAQQPGEIRMEYGCELEFGSGQAGYGNVVEQIESMALDRPEGVGVILHPNPCMRIIRSFGVDPGEDVTAEDIDALDYSRFLGPFAVTFGALQGDAGLRSGGNLVMVPDQGSVQQLREMRIAGMALLEDIGQRSVGRIRAGAPTDAEVAYLPFETDHDASDERVREQLRGYIDAVVDRVRRIGVFPVAATALPYISLRQGGVDLLEEH